MTSQLVTSNRITPEDIAQMDQPARADLLRGTLDTRVVDVIQRLSENELFTCPSVRLALYELAREGAVCRAKLAPIDEPEPTQWKLEGMSFSAIGILLKTTCRPDVIDVLHPFTEGALRHSRDLRRALFDSARLTVEMRKMADGR